MAKSTSNKRKNKTLIYVVVVLAASGLLVSSVLGAFAGNWAQSPGQGQSSQNYEAYIADMENQISQLEDSLEVSPENVYLLTQLGNSYYQLGLLYNASLKEEETKASFASALEPYGKALELQPEDVDIRVDRAVSAFWSDNYDIAEEEFEKAIETNSTHAKAHFNYGIFLYFARNNTAGAIEMWQRVIELNPTDDPELVSHALSWIMQAEQENGELRGDPSQFDFSDTETDN